MQPTAILALAIAAVAGVSPVLADTISQDALSTRSNFCADCTVRLRSDGKIIIFNKATRDTVGLVTPFPGNDVIELTSAVKRSAKFAAGGVSPLGSRTPSLFQPRDACHAVKCQTRKVCDDHGCDLGCGEHDMCYGYVAMPSFCARGCKIIKRGDTDEALVVDGETSDLVGEAKLM